MTALVEGMQPRDPNFEARVRSSFAKQAFMATLGAHLDFVRPGDVQISMEASAAHSQQHGFVHAGAIASILDSACGYAAFSLAAPETGVLSVEFKINLLAPARGNRFFARARVVRSGRTLTVCQAECRASDAATGPVIAVMQATIMILEQREGVRD